MSHCVTIMKTFCGIVSLFTTYPTSFQIYSFLKTMLIYDLIGSARGAFLGNTADKVLVIKYFSST
jgi:hypothetical protein